MKYFLIFVLFLSSLAFAQSEEDGDNGRKKVMVRVSYLNNIFGHVHQNPSRYSTSLTTIGCGHPVKIYKLVDKKGKEQILFDEQFYYVKVGPYLGYVDRSFLSSKKVECFQDRYPRFFDSLELDLSDLYYWGKLYDQYVHGKSKVQ